MDTSPLSPSLPPAPYVGGKRNLARRIIALQQGIPHRTYVEPFVGMGGVFLRRPWRSKAEVINDLSVDVTTLFRMLQVHYQAFVDMLRWQLTTRTDFERLRDTRPEGLTDLQRAARFLYLQRVAYGGKVQDRAFGVSRDNPGRFDMAKLEPMLADIHERLSGVVIERLPYAEVLRRYDGPSTLFYLDPPYWGSERDYGDGFGRADFAALAELLGQVRGRWVMSINDVPGVRATFEGHRMEEVGVTYMISGKPTEARELIISGGLEPS